MSLWITMKRNNKLNPNVVSSKVESEAIATATNYANGEMVEASDFSEGSGGKSFYRLPRHFNSGLLKTISRKLPCLNYRRSSASSKEGVGFGELNQSQNDVSCNSTINVKEISQSSRQGKVKNRATCPVMPPIRLSSKTGVDKISSDVPAVRKPSLSLVCKRSDSLTSGSDICTSTVPEILSTKVEVEDRCYATATSSNRLPQVPFDNSSEVHMEVFYSNAPQTRSLAVELYRLAKYGWYWGPISRSEAEERLHGQPDGAFLVRDSSDDRYLLSLSFRSFHKTLHTRIEHSNGMFSFYVQPEIESHASVVELIEHSMNHSQSGVFCYSKARTPGAQSYPVRLTRPVSRFTQVRSLQYLCRFVIRQRTRVDLIQDLPLPNRIKGYIKEAHY